MKSKLPIAIAVLAVLVLALIGYLKSVPGTVKEKNPKIEISPASFDFGQISFGTIARQTFKIKNSGEEVLEIKRVATSCGCTAAKTVNDKISPGEETDLLVAYDTAAMGSGPHGRGKQERIIYIRSNDPLKPQLEILINAFVQ